MPIPIEPIPLKVPSFLHDLAVGLGAEYASEVSDVLVAPASREMSKLIHWTTPQRIVNFLGQEERCFFDPGDSQTPPTVVPIGDIFPSSSLKLLVFPTVCERCGETFNVLISQAESAEVDFLNGHARVPIRDIAIGNFRFLSRLLKIKAMDAGVFLSEDNLGYFRSTCPRCRTLFPNERLAVERHTGECRSISVEEEVVVRGAIIELAEPWDSSLSPGEQALEIIGKATSKFDRRSYVSSNPMPKQSNNGLAEILDVMRKLSEIEEGSVELEIPLKNVPDRDKPTCAIKVSLLHNDMTVSYSSVVLSYHTIANLQRFISDLIKQTGALSDSPDLSRVYVSLENNGSNEIQISSVSTHNV